MQIFKTSCERDGIIVRGMASFVLTTDVNQTLTSQMQAIKRAKTNVNALIVGNTPSAIAALKAAAQNGLAGPDFVWMGVDGWFSSELVTAQQDPQVMRAADGALGLVPFFKRSGSAYEAFLEEWRSTEPLSQSDVGPLSPVNVSESCNAACLENPPWGGAYAYEATKLVANAWAAALEAGRDPRDLVAGDLLQEIRSVEITNGLLGNLTLDSDGNPKERKYDVYQLQARSPWTAVGTIDDTQGLQLYGGTSLENDTDLNFGLGPGVVPKDGSGPVADESELIEWLPDDPNNAQFGPGYWIFAAKNVYDEQVTVTQEICEEFEVRGKIPVTGELVYNTTCEVPDSETLSRIDGTFEGLQLNGLSPTYDEVRDSYLNPVTMDSLCACPLRIPSSDVTIPPAVNLYVTYDGDPLPGMNPYIAFPPAQGDSEILSLLRIILPVVFGLLLVTLGGLLFYIMKVKRDAENAWLIKLSELEFDSPPKVLGKGGQGEVLEARFRGTTVAVKRNVVGLRDLVRSEASARSEANGNGSDDIEAAAPSPFDASPFYRSMSPTQSKLTMKKSILRCFGKTKRAVLNRQESLDLNSLSMGSTVMSQAQAAKAFLSSIKLASKLRHPNIVQTMGAVVQRNSQMHVMERMENGSMQDVIFNGIIPVDLELVVGVLRDTAKGLRYLHEADPPIIHGDLKSGNILVDDRLTGKITDFGMSAVGNRAAGTGGTVLWMAPELLAAMEDDDVSRSPTLESDVYAYGVLMFELLLGLRPYSELVSSGGNVVDLVREVTENDLRPTVPAPNEDGSIGKLGLRVPAELLELMTECWAKNPDRRPKVAEVESRIQSVCSSHQLARTDLLKQQASLLADIFPPRVRKALSEGRKVEPEGFDPVTIFFSDIVGFTLISQTIPPEKVMTMLDDMYSRFDSLVKTHGLFKVETIGDAYMCVGGLPEPQSDHALRVGSFALEAINAAGKVLIDREDKKRGFVEIRAGFHSGSVVASVVGSTNPRYCLFGDTVNTASRMESNSHAGMVNMSPQAHQMLMQQCPDAKVVDRGKINIKGKGVMNCYFLK